VLSEQQYRERRKITRLVDGIGIPETVFFETIFYSSSRSQSMTASCLKFKHVNLKLV